MITLKEANSLSEKEFVRRFGPLYEGSSWVAEGAESRRPFGSVEEMHGVFRSVVEGASEARKLALVRAHPDLAGRASLAGELTPESESEQSSAGLDRLALEEYERFTEMNEAYRERFGMPMVVCVRGMTKEEILLRGEERIANTPEEELGTALGEVCKIGRMRLGDLVED